MENFRIINAEKRIALVAHDNKKPELLAWVIEHREILARHDLVGTGTTGKLVEEALGQPVVRLLSGPLGGDQQLGAMIAEEKVDLVIFFWDPLSAQPHDPDVKALLRLCVVWNIPLACDRATADFIITSSLMNQIYYSQQTDFTKYLNRKI